MAKSVRKATGKGAKTEKSRSKDKKASQAKKIKKEELPEKKAEVRKVEPDIQGLLKLRRELQKRRPKFQRQESWRYKRLETTWRRPRGIDSKMRKEIQGWPKVVNIGYRGPKATRGRHPSGYRDVLVHNLREVDSLNPETDALRLSARLGRRYRTSIVAKAEELGIKVLNPINVGPK